MANATWYAWPTNFSNGTAITGVGSWFQYMNVVTEGYLGATILLIIWVLVFFGGMLMGVKRAAASSCFITFVFSVYFWRLGMVNPVISVGLIIATILFAIGAKGEGGAY